MEKQAALQALKQLYADHLEEFRQLDKGSALERLLRGGPDRAERQSVSGFFAAVEAAVGALCALLDPEDGPLAAEALSFMLLEARGNDSASELTVAAAQALAIPLIPWIPSEEAARLLEAYTARLPGKKPFTPRQKDLVRALKAR